MGYSNRNDLYELVDETVENIYFRKDHIDKIVNAVWNAGYRKPTLKISNNPIDILLAVFERYFPQTAEKIKTIQFANIDDGFACTDFADDGSISIFISPTIKNDEPITFEVATELLAHELAHAITGKDEEEHGVIWEAQFDKLNELYVQEAKRISNAEN